MMNAMQMPMNMNAAMPMMPMMGMPMMMATMQCETMDDGMLCKMMPAMGMDMGQFRNSAEMMAMMMNCGMPMMMQCGNLAMMGMSQACMAMMPTMGMGMGMPMMGMAPMKCMMECSMQGDAMHCRMMPMQGMDMEMFKNCCMLMAKIDRKSVV